MCDSEPSAATTTATSNRSSRCRTGVADYFAILGVGDQLIWKHMQKQEQQQQLTDESAITVHATNQTSAATEYDDAAAEYEEAQERFNREIVEITILASVDSNEGSSKAPSEVSSVAIVENNPSELPAMATAVLSASSSSLDQPSSSNNKQHALSSPWLLTSPSHSTESSHHPKASLQPAASQQHQHEEPDGWTVIHQTLPCASAVFGGSMEGTNIQQRRQDGGGNVSLQSYPDNQAGGSSSNSSAGPLLWNKYTVWDANLSCEDGGLRDEVRTRQQVATQKQGAADRLRRKVESTLQKVQHLAVLRRPATAPSPKFYLAYRRRLPETADRPAIADVRLWYVRLHTSTCCLSSWQQQQHAGGGTATASDGRPASLADNHRHKSLPGLAGQILERYQASHNKQQQGHEQEENANLLELSQQLHLPQGFDEWAIPEEYQWIRDPLCPPIAPYSSSDHNKPDGSTIIAAKTTTVLFAHDGEDNGGGVEASFDGMGVEAIEETISDISAHNVDPTLRFPVLLDASAKGLDSTGVQYHYVPVLAIRRQRVGEEERYHEDPAIVDLAVTFMDHTGTPILPSDTLNDDDFEEEEDEGTFRLLGKTSWSAHQHGGDGESSSPLSRKYFGSPMIIVRRNLPYGFADAAFATKVQGRFPLRNYMSLPLPEEELPMFCYPTGCRLHRARFCDAPVAQYYGFVVKNERGDSIYVSCVSFMEPLTPEKASQLSVMSEKRKSTSLPHRRYCERRRATTRTHDSGVVTPSRKGSFASTASTEADSNFLLTSFDEMTTFENKTICLVSRFPFWTAFRKFLLHMHILSGTSSDLPLERYISHLLLSVPLPRPGGSNVLIPLPALSEPMTLSMPPEKDFPLVDLPYQRVFACLEIRAIVTIVLSLLALERKIIVMSTRPSLVLDVCELLRSLLFPFELCAPYVPRLTEPFKSSLDFPGAIFVGIHDDGSPHGLAAMVKATYPEDSIIVDLDTGDIDCFGDRIEVITSAWDIIPISARSVLCSELETLCRDAGIVDGQEPLDSQFDSAFDVALESAVNDIGVSSLSREPFDDRGARDAFLRFFCAVLGGYERFLVVPDADFLVSGNEWFDAQGFLASVPSENAPYLTSLVGTQLFQSFIQRRTEASDVHCLLFDESLAEFHSSSVPYGRLGGDVEVFSTEGHQPQMLYSLLVDQSATPIQTAGSGIGFSRSLDTVDDDTGLNLSKFTASLAEQFEVQFAETAVNKDGDLVTAPTLEHLPPGVKYSYCIDGNPCFPHKLKPDLFLPIEPESLLVEVSKSTSPLLARSGRELEEANRRRRMATSYRGFQAQRRCLWQLPKLMGSHFLGAWLLCIPAQVSQQHLSHEQQSMFLLRALGALRVLRSKQRIVPDEAAYRALMVACGRAKSDRRVELVKLFGLLRSDGIFPSAVTLGQYTKALAEGYSKRSSGVDKEEDLGGVEVTESGSRFGRYSFVSPNHRGTTDFEATLNALDPSLAGLEDHGRRWRHRTTGGIHLKEKTDDKKKRHGARPWLPVSLSSSFAPGPSATPDRQMEMQFVAMWSRTRACGSCCYIPLDEEVQAGWDVVGGENEIPGAVACPRCGTLIIPMLGYRELSLAEASKIGVPSSSGTSFADFEQLPPQVSPVLDTSSEIEEKCSFVTYVSPSALRVSLEQCVEEYGEAILDREKLKELDPEVFYNLWWYCTRFSLPFPLPVSLRDDGRVIHYCAFAGWDRVVAERGCWSAAKVLEPLFDGEGAAFSFDFNNVESLEEMHLLARFNLQGFYSSVWDHPDLSKILVTLVEACDKRDFRSVVECILQANQSRREQFEPDLDGSVVGSEIGERFETATASGASALVPSAELDVYRTILYLAKYQCTSAFHAFFPATLKACKGYHFWCAIGAPLPIIDRLVREGAQRLNSSKENKTVVTFQTVSEVALGFRCVFGHLI